MCVCHRKSFELIKKEAEEKGLSKPTELYAYKICGCGCGMCQPYVEKMMRTGETAFVPGDYF